MEEEIRPCIRYAWCTGRLMPPFFKRIRCSVNPMLGRETEYPVCPCPSPHPGRVMIIGGSVVIAGAGLTGSECAIALAQNATESRFTCAMEL